MYFILQNDYNYHPSLDIIFLLIEFNEEKYGCYADFAVWLEAGSKNYVFKDL